MARPFSLAISAAYGPIISTCIEQTPAVEVIDRDRLRRWQASQQAQVYARRWVVLDHDYAVIDSDHSAVALQHRHPYSSMIVFADPRPLLTD
jgi:hypothetical protein